jgi:hypothetical protein
VADSAKVGPCKWDAGNEFVDEKCVDASCGDATNETSCIAATENVPPKKFMFGSAPYGKTPCHWDGRSCNQIYECGSYRSQDQCKKDSARFGKCRWNSLKQRCQDMQLCSHYEDASSCASDSYGVASIKHAKAQCWWKAGPPAITVGPELELKGLWKSNGPVKTSKNLQVKDDRTLDVLDGKGFAMALALGLDSGALSSRQVVQVEDGTGATVPLANLPKPLPDGYSIHLNGACDDNLHFSFADFVGVDCNKATEAACAPPPTKTKSAAIVSTQAVVVVTGLLIWTVCLRTSSTI